MLFTLPRPLVQRAQGARQIGAPTTSSPMRRKGAGLTHSLFMDDRAGTIMVCRSEPARWAALTGWWGKGSRRQESARASAEGVIHWIDVIEFWFLLYCLLLWLRLRVARRR